MSVDATRRPAPWDVLVDHPLQGVLRRLVLFTIAGVGSMLLITAGAAFYAYVWPGVPHPSERTQPPPIATPQAPAQSGAPTEKWIPIAPQAEIPVAKLEQKDVIGKKMYDQYGAFLGYIVKVNTDEKGKLISFEVSESTMREANVPAADVKVFKSNSNSLTVTTSEKPLQWEYIGPGKAPGFDPIEGPKR
jgi:hypothetical protein